MIREPVYDAALLSARAEITDVIHLFCHALDRHRWDLMAYAFHPDATVKYNFRPNAECFEDWVGRARATMSAFPCTMHTISNILIDVQGDTAWAESYVTAIHRVPTTAPREGFWDGRDAPYDGTGAGRYFDQFERRDGKWKIAARQALIEWRNDVPLRESSFSVATEERVATGFVDGSRRRPQ